MLESCSDSIAYSQTTNFSECPTYNERLDTDANDLSGLLFSEEEHKPSYMSIGYLRESFGLDSKPIEEPNSNPEEEVRGDSEYSEHYLVYQYDDSLDKYIWVCNDL